MKTRYKQTEDLEAFINEAPTMYKTARQTLPLNELSAMDKMAIARKGISKSYLESLKRAMDLDYDSLAKALSVTRATLINKKGAEKFSDQLSERIVSLADLYSFGYEVFEDEERFNHWMLYPNEALGGLAPFDIVDSVYGREEINHLIGRIAYGVYS